jgi:hypothetical protein
MSDGCFATGVIPKHERIVTIEDARELQIQHAAIARSIMALLCLALVALTVRSFVVARLARRKA